LYAHKEARYASRFGQSWEKAVEAATLDMKADLASILN
jgi:hypothetical protein